MVGLEEILVEKGLLTAGDLARANEVRRHSSARLPATLVRLGMVPELDLAEAQAAAAGLPILGRADFPETLPRLGDLNPRFLARHAIAPVAFDEGRLTLAMADAGDEEALAGIAFATGAGQVERMVATFSDIEETLGTHLVAEDLSGPMDDLAGAGATDDIERLAEGESDAPIIRLVQRLLANAVNRRASDVHIEPMARSVSVRYRIDGRLVEVERHPDSIAAPIASRIKVMAGLDIAESRLPQDGRLRLTVGGRDVDVRVSTSPIAHGESIVLRLLGRSEVPLDLDRLGLPETALAKLNRALDRPHGIILLTGPTGSGKTTTLYAAINRLRRPDVKILTVEDPVEVLLEGVNQVQVRPEIDLSYAATLRAFLRQDPDILMIGEIRDEETAEIALRAALTGHLVLSTLHTNSAIGAFTRLADIGIEPYLTASTVIAAIAQRLIRSLCPSCRTSRSPDRAERALFEQAGMTPPSLVHEPAGCAGCTGTGYRGRLPLIEILEVDETIREHIRTGDVESFKDDRPAIETLLGHGLTLVADGRTSLAEVERAVQLG
jgi:general secretion pathway protein E